MIDKSKDMNKIVPSLNRLPHPLLQLLGAVVFDVLHTTQQQTQLWQLH
jgi:hypothetical protein